MNLAFAVITSILIAAPPQAHFSRAQKLFAQGRYRDALDGFTAASEAAPTEVPELWFNIGQCHRNLGHSRQAVASFRRYLALNPEAEDRQQVVAMIGKLGGATDDLTSPPQPRAEPHETASTPPPPVEPDPAPAPPPVAAPPVVVDPAPSAVPPAALSLSVPPEPRRKPERWKTWVGVVVGVTATVGISLGVGLGVGLHATPSQMTHMNPDPNPNPNQNPGPMQPPLDTTVTFDTRGK
jgi:hypothetical protein